MSVESLASELKKIVSSRYFFYSILFLATAQGLWYALSFIPSIFDESKHFGRIVVYSHQISPFISEQKPEWDYLSAIPRDPFYLFYYLMSWPLRLVRIFSESASTQIIFLRLINISFFVTGLIYYRKALLATRKIPMGVINVTLLVLVLTPSFAPLPGAINYDNLIFLLFAVLLLKAIQVVMFKKINFVHLASFFLVGLFMILIKWTSAALFLPLMAYIIYHLFITHGKKLLQALKKSARGVKMSTKLLIVFGLILASALMIERPIINTIRYGRPAIKCNQIISHERCLKHRDYEVYNNVANNKPENFEPVSIGQYSLMYWIPRMINTSVTLLPWSATRTAPALPVIRALYSLFAFSSVVLILVNLKELLKSRALKSLLFISAVYISILVVFLYSAYVKYAIPAAISSRYLLPIFPIIIALAIVSALEIFKKRRSILVVSFLLVIILFTQGGGITTHLLTAKDGLYWDNKVVKSVNNQLRTLIQPLIKE